MWVKIFSDKDWKISYTISCHAKRAIRSLSRWEKVTPMKNSDLQEVVKISGNGKYVRKYKKILWVPFSYFICYLFLNTQYGIK